MAKQFLLYKLEKKKKRFKQFVNVCICRIKYMCRLKLRRNNPIYDNRCITTIRQCINAHQMFSNCVKDQAALTVIKFLRETKPITTWIAQQNEFFVKIHYI